MDDELKYTKLRRPKGKGSAQLFDNPILEKLTHTHIAVPLILFGLIASGLIYFGITERGFSPDEIIVLFALGLLAFSLVEYLMHRFVYHMPVTSARKQKIAYTMHGNHHDYPKDKSRLAMPPLLGLVIAAVFYGLFRLLMGVYVYGFLAGFIIGYALYLGIHYSIHAFHPPHNFLKTIWYHHSIHHYREDDRAFGVSSPLWDHVFGTMPRKNPKAFRRKKKA